jgi:hypothetical protein
MMYMIDFLSFCYFFFLLLIVYNCEGERRTTSFAEFISLELQSRLERWHFLTWFEQPQ